MVKGRIAELDYILPEQELSTSRLASMFPGWSVAQIDKKTGIQVRHIVGADQTIADLAVGASKKVFESGVCCACDVDFVILCTQTADLVLPATACIVQDRLGIPTTAGALDINLGCSGYVYCLGVAEGLIMSGQARMVLLVTADAYSRYLSPEDRSARTIFGDAAAATVVMASTEKDKGIGPFVYGTDGSGAGDLYVERLLPKTGQVRDSRSEYLQTEVSGTLHMNGAKLVDFALSVVPKVVSELLDKAKCGMEEIDLFVFHQANAYLLERIRDSLQIPHHKFQISLKHCGNTVSSSIPIALKDAQTAGRLKPGTTVALVAFGVGLSWGGALLRL